MKPKELESLAFVKECAIHLNSPSIMSMGFSIDYANNGIRVIVRDRGYNHHVIIPFTVIEKFGESAVYGYLLAMNRKIVKNLRYETCVNPIPEEFNSKGEKNMNYSESIEAVKQFSNMNYSESIEAVKQFSDYLSRSSISNLSFSMSDMHERKVPKIKRVIFNGPATIVFWSDNTKTIVKAENETFDPEKGLAMAIAKKALGNEGNYYNEFKKYLGDAYEAKF